jgi:hypothetical protein
MTKAEREHHLAELRTDAYLASRKDQRIQSLEEENKALKTKLAYAEDAAAKGDLARQNAGGMEMRIGELEEENKRLREALEPVVASWKRHGPRIIESRGGLEDNRVSEVNGAIDNAAKALTKPT